MDDNDKIRKIKEALNQAKPIKPTRKKSPPAAPGVIYVNGAGNVVGDSNQVFNIHQPVLKPVTVVKTGDGVINAQQKARLTELVRAWLALRNAVRKKPITFASAWNSVNKKARVNSYHEIAREDFVMVEAWLIQQIAIVNAMPSAKVKSTNWRASRIKSIQARCNELGIQDKRKLYMLKTFGKDSLTNLGDDEIEKVYRWAMSKK